MRKQRETAGFDDVDLEEEYCPDIWTMSEPALSLYPSWLASRYLLPDTREGSTTATHLLCTKAACVLWLSGNGVCTPLVEALFHVSRRMETRPTTNCQWKSLQYIDG